MQSDPHPLPYAEIKDTEERCSGGGSKTDDFSNNISLYGVLGQAGTFIIPAKI